jgi:peptidoglycan/xylan/chitin deacetylase (PgdA/CDA1 family)
LALKKLIETGHEIGSHSVTHNWSIMEKQPEIEARKSKELIDGWLGTKVSSFCYPYYRSHTRMEPLQQHRRYVGEVGQGFS